MTDFVIDNSVTMRWLLATNKKVDQQYADTVLKSLLATEAMVPDLWRLEAANVLLSSEKRLEIDAVESERFISQLENLPIFIDNQTSHKAFNRTMTLARIYKLSSYDASYLELAIRAGLPLATLDRSLVKAARKSNVPIYLKD